jgi:hypothetical protein
MKWYKRDPAAALEGMIGLTAEERGYYNTLLDLLYARAPRGEVTDLLVVKAMGERPQVWRRVKAALIAKGKVHDVEGKLTANRVETEVKQASYLIDKMTVLANKRWKNKKVVDAGTHMTTTTTTRSKNKSPSDSPPISDQGLFPDSPRNARASVRKNPYPKEFEEFYAHYPLHVGKDAALKAWERVTEQGKATKDELIAGADRYRDDPNRDPSYTKHPATWLNAGCHNDGPLPVRGNGHGRVMTYKDKRQEDLEDAKRALKASIARDDAERESDQDDRPSDGILPFPRRS